MLFTLREAVLTFRIFLRIAVADYVQADLNQEKFHLTFASERLTYYAANND